MYFTMHFNFHSIYFQNHSKWWSIEILIRTTGIYFENTSQNMILYCKQFVLRVGDEKYCERTGSG